MYIKIHLKNIKVKILSLLFWKAPYIQLIVTMHICTQCVDAIKEFPEDVLFLQEVNRDLRQRCAKFSTWLWGPAQFPNLNMSAHR